MAEERSYWERFWQRRLSRRRVLKGAALAGAGLSAAAIIGCGGEEEKPAATATPAAATPAAATPAAAAPKQGGTLVAHDGGEPVFDNYLAWSYRSCMYNSMCYPRLLKFKVYPGAPVLEYDVEPDLARSMPEQPDDTTYTFKLLPAKWEDKAGTNGRELTSEDVKVAFERHSEIHPNRTLFTGEVASVTAPDKETVTFKLNKPLGPFLRHIGHQGMFYILNRELVDAEETKTDMVSAGPFILEKYDVGVGVSLKRNPDYYRAPLPNIDRLEVRIIPDSSTWLSALRSKALDSLLWVGMSQLDKASLERDLPNATFTSFPFAANMWLGVDGKNPIFKDPRVRQAVSMTLDRDALLAVAGGEGDWLTQITSLPKWWLNPKDKAKFGANAKYYHHDLAAAKQLLSAAGHPDGITGLPLDVAIAWYPTRKSENELVHAQLKEGGIDTDLKVMEFGAFYAKHITKADWEGLAYAGNLIGSDPNDWFSILWNPDSPRVIVEELLDGDTDLQNRLEQQRRELNEERRVEIVHDIQRYLAEKMYNVPAPIPYLYHVQQDYVKDMHYIWTYGPGPEYLDTLWLDKA